MTIPTICARCGDPMTAEHGISEPCIPRPRCPPRAPAPRRPVHVSVAGVANNQGTQCNYVTTVICNDGTIWESTDTRPDWIQLRLIPQGECSWSKP